MHSTTSSRRRRQSRPPRHHLLEATARIIDDATIDDPGHMVVQASEELHELVLGFRSFDVGIHPFVELAGCTAEPGSSMVGLRVRGTAHHLDGSGRSERTSTTFVVHRSGEERSVLRNGLSVVSLPGPASGTLPDLCRRMLGVPTAPAPPSSALLWTVVWLDRIMERWAEPTHRSGLSAWSDLAQLHPAVADAARRELVPSLDVPRLIDLGRAHAEGWPWGRLRAEPERLHLPDGDLPRPITEWMDDGFYARWAIGAFPPPATLARDLSHLLNPELGGALVTALEGLLR